jgi:hypothetical protein
VRRALTDLRFLWGSRKGSGFPWPFEFARRAHGRTRAWALMFGYPPWAAIPVWRQALGIPLRPWRYARMVLGIARTRAIFFTASMYDDVP